MFGKLFVGACQIICVSVEKCGEISSRVSGAAEEEKAIAKIAAIIAKAFIKFSFVCERDEQLHV